jgi:hypothetical protein
MVNWLVVAPMLARPRVQLLDQLYYRSWISVMGSTAAEVQSDIHSGNEPAAANFVLA